jgi:16S rRNA (uracil1498-N3)-methyltransferase
MRRFFVRPEDVSEPELRLRGDEAAHLLHALRLRPGTSIVTFDGLGREYVATIERLDEDEVICHITCERGSPHAQGISIALGQGLPKGDKFEWIIQKTTELGVTELVPLLTERAVPRLSGPRVSAKRVRWDRLAREACKQCGRSVVPRLYSPMSLDTFCMTFRQADLRLLLWEEERGRRLRTVLGAAPQVASAAIIIGPEGGLTPTEVVRGESYGFLTVGLGERILRTETASMAVVALLQHRFGDLG